MAPCNNEQLKFSVFIINNLAHHLDKPVDSIYKTLSETGILDEYVLPCYDVLHTLGKEYLMEDITEFMKTRGVVV